MGWDMKLDPPHTRSGVQVLGNRASYGCEIQHGRKNMVSDVYDLRQQVTLDKKIRGIIKSNSK